jgi:hypothetical protein
MISNHGASLPTVMCDPGGVPESPIIVTSIFNGNRREDIWLDK